MTDNRIKIQALGFVLGTASSYDFIDDLRVTFYDAEFDAPIKLPAGHAHIDFSTGEIEVEDSEDYETILITTTFKEVLQNAG